MIQIRPVSDLRNKFTELEEIVKSGQPVYLTKNGHGTMVLVDIEQYTAMADDFEAWMDEMDRAAAEDPTRYTLEEAKAIVRGYLHEREVL